MGFAHEFALGLADCLAARGKFRQKLPFGFATGKANVMKASFENHIWKRIKNCARRGSRCT